MNGEAVAIRIARKEREAVWRFKGLAGLMAAALDLLMGSLEVVDFEPNGKRGPDG